MADRKNKPQKPETEKAIPNSHMKNIPCVECGKGILPRKMNKHLSGHRLARANKARNAQTK